MRGSCALVKAVAEILDPSKLPADCRPSQFRCVLIRKIAVDAVER